jgi:hypothetical protein
MLGRRAHAAAGRLVNRQELLECERVAQDFRQGFEQRAQAHAGLLFGGPFERQHPMRKAIESAQIFGPRMQKQALGDRGLKLKSSGSTAFRPPALAEAIEPPQDVQTALAKRRQVKLEERKPRVEIASKASGFDVGNQGVEFAL